MYTINTLISLAEKKLNNITNKEGVSELQRIKKELQDIKKAPELMGSCSIDFKLSNGDYYYKRIMNVNK